MKIPDRDAIEARLANKLARLGASQRRELMDYLGVPPDFSRVPQAYWDKVGLDLRGVLSAEIIELYLDAAERLDISTPGAVDWGLINENAVTWTRNYTYDLVRGITNTTRRAISEAVSDFFELGQTRADLEARLVRLFGPVRAEMIAITEVTRASVEGERAVARNLAAQGIQMIPYWLTRNDELVCPICGPKHNKPITDDQYPPAHPRCLPGNTFVLPVGGVASGSKRRYEGYMVIIEAAEHQLAATPNHPILTRRGWVAAGKLVQGDDVLCYGWGNYSMPANLDERNSVTTIENIFGSLGVGGFRVPVSPPDFHGDGGDSEVAIIRTNSHIDDGQEANVVEKTAQGDFIPGNVVVDITLPHEGAVAKLIEGDGSPSRRFVGGSDLAKTLLFGHPAPLDGLGLGLVAGSDTSIQDHFTDDSAGNAVFLSETVLALSGKVTVDNVRSVSEMYFSGHVYNLQTETGLYVAAGIITHNCRCDIRHELP